MLTMAATSSSTAKRRNRKKLRLSAGVTFDEKYASIGELLGEGNAGRVESFVERASGKIVAVKVRTISIF